MAAPSYTYTLTNGTTADATQVQQNFSDILNGVSDGTKDLSISALTVAGTATLNGNINVGNASGDDLTVTASLASSLPIKTNNSYDIGSATLGLRKLYLGNGGVGATCDIVSASHATTREYTIPDCSAAASFVMTQSAQTVAGQLTFSSPLLGPAGSASLPAFSHSGDPNTGSYNVGADDWGVATGGTLRFDVSTTGITSTIPHLNAAGSASAPAYSFSSDPDTGMSGLGSNVLTLATGGTEVQRCDASLNTGFGTGATISAKLQVKGAGTSTGGNLRLEDSSTNALLIMSDSGLCVFSHAGTETMRLTAGGLVGINTGGTVSAKLQMKGTGTGTAENFRCEDSATNTTFSVLDNGAISIRRSGWASSANTAVVASTTTLDLLTSSRSHKENIVPMGIDSSNIYKLTAVEFDYRKEKGGHHGFGYIAEDVAEFFKEIVIREADEKGQLVPYSINYIQLAVLAIEEMKKLNKRLLAVEQKLA